MTSSSFFWGKGLYELKEIVEEIGILNENEEEMIIIMIKMRLNDCNHDFNHQEMIVIIFKSKLQKFWGFSPGFRAWIEKKKRKKQKKRKKMIKIMIKIMIPDD